MVAARGESTVALPHARPILLPPVLTVQQRAKPRERHSIGGDGSSGEGWLTSGGMDSSSASDSGGVMEEHLLGLSEERPIC